MYDIREDLDFLEEMKIDKFCVEDCALCQKYDDCINPAKNKDYYRDFLGRDIVQLAADALVLKANITLFSDMVCFLREEKSRAELEERYGKGCLRYSLADDNCRIWLYSEGKNISLKLNYKKDTLVFSEVGMEIKASMNDSLSDLIYQWKKNKKK